MKNFIITVFSEDALAHSETEVVFENAYITL